MTTVSFEVMPLDEAPIYALTQEWVFGESPKGADGPEVTFSLTCGAGLGSTLMRLAVYIDGKRYQETIDIQDGLTAWVNRIVENAKQIQEQPS